MNYIDYINLAEKAWYKGNLKEAIKYYELALDQKQTGRITKKSVRKNIEELNTQYHEKKQN